MLIRGVRSLVLFACPLFLLLFIGAGLYQRNIITLPSDLWADDEGRWPAETVKEKNEAERASMKAYFEAMKDLAAEEQKKKNLEFDPTKTHRVISSISTEDRKYFDIDFGDHEAYNANLIPHPQNNHSWIVVAQRKSHVKDTVWFAQLVCEGVFRGGRMVCDKSPLLLPIGATTGDQCKGKIAHFSFNIGPHDARVFYGPKFPIAMFGSNSRFACFGMWVQDMRTLIDWGHEHFEPGQFRQSTELQRPGSYGDVEKNWFMFWDSKGKPHAHYDLVPRRVYASLEYDGSCSKNIASKAAVNDVKCLKSYLPEVNTKDFESIHQATNSLSITMCKRSDPSCVPDDSNTFIMSIFQHKTFYMFHSVYEPYVMLMKQNSPFEVHGISKRPLWVNGRGYPGEKDQPEGERQRPENHSAMIYITSMSWKHHGQKYHGYLDDAMFLGFGIEDSRTGAIDVVASDLLQDIALCSDV